MQSVAEDIYTVAIKSVVSHRRSQLLQGSATLSFPGCSCHRRPSAAVVSVNFLLRALTLSVQFLLAVQRGCASGNRTRNRAVNKTLDKMALLLSIGRSPLTKPGRIQSAPLTIHIPGLGRLASHPAATANTSGLGLEPARQDDECWQFHM
jgi:hypothetical protein